MGLSLFWNLAITLHPVQHDRETGKISGETGYFLENWIDLIDVHIAAEKTRNGFIE